MRGLHPHLEMAIIESWKARRSLARHNKVFARAKRHLDRAERHLAASDSWTQRYQRLVKQEGEA